MESFSYYYGVNNRDYIEGIVNAWMDDIGNSKHRFDDIRRFLPDARRVLDIGSGCGTFVFYGLMNGLDVHGVDPEEWKREFNIMKADEAGYPTEWLTRFHMGVGENLPFPDNRFDCVSSYQTLEHVQAPCRVVAEMIRVTRPGGGIHIRCPDYRGTFEGHYRLPWLPLFPRYLARAYLRLLGRPTDGLDSLQYVTRPRVLKWVRLVQKSSDSELVVIDVDEESFYDTIRKRGLPRLAGSFSIYCIFRFIGRLFRRDIGVNLFIMIVRK